MCECLATLMWVVPWKFLNIHKQDLAGIAAFISWILAILLVRKSTPIWYELHMTLFAITAIYTVVCGVLARFGKKPRVFNNRRVKQATGIMCRMSLPFILYHYVWVSSAKLLYCVLKGLFAMDTDNIGWTPYLCVHGLIFVLVIACWKLFFFAQSKIQNYKRAKQVDTEPERNTYSLRNHIRKRSSEQLIGDRSPLRRRSTTRHGTTYNVNTANQL